MLAAPKRRTSVTARATKSSHWASYRSAVVFPSITPGGIELFLADIAQQAIDLIEPAQPWWGWPIAATAREAMSTMMRNANAGSCSGS
jgi:hypothetical protein